MTADDVLTKSDRISDSYQVIENLFLYGDLPELQEQFWEFFKCTITGTYPKGLNRTGRMQMVSLYEQLYKLLEAVQVLNDNKPDEPTDLPLEKPNAGIPVYPFYEKNLLIENLHKSISGKNLSLADLKAIIEIIVTLTNAGKLFLVNLSGGGAGIAQYDFLVLMPANAPLSFAEYQQLVEDRCRSFGSVIIWCGKEPEVYRLLQEGHIFYSVMCTEERLVYDGRGTELPQVNRIDINAVMTRAREVFHNQFNMAGSFLDGVRYYISIKQYRTAAFLLHQAAEHSLRALLFSITSHNPYSHNLNNLLRRCNYFSFGLIRLFPQNTEREKEIFHLLNHAYVHSRYRSNYQVSEADLQLLSERVEELHQWVRQFFEEQLAVFEKSLSK